MDNATYSSLVSFIWRIADDCLRDVYDRGKYRDAIMPMTVIRCLVAVLEDTKPEILKMKKHFDDAGVVSQAGALSAAAKESFYNSSLFTLKDLKDRYKGQQLKVDLFAQGCK